MTPDQLIKLREVEEKHHKQLVELSHSLYVLPHPTITNVTGLTPWDILPRFSARLSEALRWYESDRGGGFFPREYYTPPTPYGEIEGLFEARFFGVFNALYALSVVLPMLQPAYKLDSGWFPSEHGTIGLGLRDYSNEKDIFDTATMTQVSDKIVEFKMEIKVILDEYVKVLDSIWSGGWR